MIELITSLLLATTVPDNCPEDPELGCIIISCEGNDSIYCKSNQNRTAVTQVNIITNNLPIIPAGTTVTVINTYQDRDITNRVLTFHQISWNGNVYTVIPSEIKFN